MSFKYANKHREVLWFLSNEWSRIVRKHNLLELMEKPAFAFTTDKGKWGKWEPSTRTIHINEALAFEFPWCEVEKTLLHEMAHQWVTDCGGEAGREQTAHGPLWQQAAAMFGCAPSASNKKERNPELEKISDRIAKLLALAESANEHESQLAAARASALMMKYDIAERQTEREFTYAWVGEYTKQRPSWLAGIGGILMEHFNVQTIWLYKRTPFAEGYMLELMGTPGQIEIAQYVYDFLRKETERLWKQNKHRFSGRAKNGYVTGCLAGFASKMRDEKMAAKKDMPIEEAALVLAEDHELKGFFRKRYPSTRKSSRARSKRYDAFAAGHKAGQSITMRKGMTSKGEGGKYLTA